MQEDDHSEDARRALAVQHTCRIAQMSLPGFLADDPDFRNAEIERYKRLRDEALSQVATVDDEFYRNFAMHQIVRLCWKANDLELAEALFSRVDDDLIREHIVADCPGISVS